MEDDIQRPQSDIRVNITIKAKIIDLKNSLGVWKASFEEGSIVSYFHF